MTDQPSITKLVWSRKHWFYTGVNETARAADLATVDARIAAPAPDRTGIVAATWTAPDGLSVLATQVWSSPASLQRFAWTCTRGPRTGWGGRSGPRSSTRPGAR